MLQLAQASEARLLRWRIVSRAVNSSHRLPPRQALTPCEWSKDAALRLLREFIGEEEMDARLERILR